MPYEWAHEAAGAPENSGAPFAPAALPRATLTLRPHRSLPPRGFVWFIAITAALMALPVLAVVGTKVLWGLLPFVALAIAGMWTALKLSWRRGEIVETLTISPDRAELVRIDQGGERRWQSNPYWVHVRLHPKGGPVPNYLTLKGDGREVEIGAFLSEAERIALRDELSRAFLRAR